MVIELVGSPAPAESAAPPFALNRSSLVVTVAFTATWSKRASTGSLTSATLSVTVAAGDVIAASEAMNVNESVPKKLAFGVYSRSGAVPVRVPCPGGVTTSNVSGSDSGSVPASVIGLSAATESSSTATTCAMAAGPSVIVIVKVWAPLSSDGVPSSTALTVTLVDPAVAPGVNERCPAASMPGCTVNSDGCRASTTKETPSASPGPGEIAVAHAASYAGSPFVTWISGPFVNDGASFSASTVIVKDWVALSSAGVPSSLAKMSTEVVPNASAATVYVRVPSDDTP